MHMEVALAILYSHLTLLLWWAHFVQYTQAYVHYKSIADLLQQLVNGCCNTLHSTAPHTKASPPADLSSSAAAHGWRWCRRRGSRRQ